MCQGEEVREEGSGPFPLVSVQVPLSPRPWLPDVTNSVAQSGPGSCHPPGQGKQMVTKGSHLANHFKVPTHNWSWMNKQQQRWLWLAVLRGLSI